MKSGDQTPTLSQVQNQWQPWKLNEAGEEIKTRNTEFGTLIDQTVTQIRDAGSHWSGDAYYAAYDRIAGDRDTANKMAQETTELANALINGGNTLTGYRQSLLDKVTEATTAGFKVSDDWQVTASGDGAGEEDLHTHQTAITTALNEMVGTQAGITTAIEQANTAVQTQSAALGEGDPIDTVTGSPKSTLTAQQISADQPASTVPAATQEKAQEQVPAAGSPKNITEQKTVDPSAAAPAKTDTKDQPVKTDTKDQPVKTDTKDQPVKTDTKDQPTKVEPTTPDTTKVGSGSANDPNSWTPANVISLISTVGTITGNVPTLIESIGKLDDDWDDIIKAGGEAGKNLVDSAGGAAEKLASAADKIITSVDHAVDNTTPADPQKPSAPGTPDSTQPGTTDKPQAPPANTQTGQPQTPPANTQTGQPQTPPANTQTGQPQTPPANTQTGQPQTPPANTHTQSAEQAPAPSNPATYTGNPAATTPASSSLFGLPSPTRGNESDREHRPNNYVIQPAEPEAAQQ
ncbi:hypothetical protein AB0M22_36145 [Nocardia sp. NPDC051756]|uniref:hypothetical protein n=1 Tax=Nocardia sp. NPDC051756 TaxID=3154751 RepID=UPI00341C0DA8